MAEEPKKLTFGFSKVIKKPKLMQGKKLDEPKKVEMIKCLEGQSIKLVQEKQEEKLLVIPLLDSRKTTAALASLQKRKDVLDGVEPDETEEESKPQETQPTDNSLESKAVKELLSEANKESEEETSNLVLPLKPEDIPLDGAKESSIDDYENIPINQFGLAMLRGMGWKEEAKKKKGPKYLDSPFVRPKGMGLGADKAIKAKPLLVAPDQNEVLEIKKNAYVRVLAGKHKDLYAQIEGLDDHAGRVIVKMALGGSKESFNEFLLQPVPKKEFQQYGKVINAEKYDKYKQMENEFGQIKVEKLKEEIKNDVKKERKSEERWPHDKYNRRDKRSPSKNGSYKSSQISKYDDKDSKREYKESRRDYERDSRREDDVERISRNNSRRDDSREDHRVQRDEKHSSRREKDRSETRHRKRSDSEDSYKSTKHKSKKSYKKHSSDSEDEDHRRKHKKKSSKSKKSHQSDYSEDEGRSKRTKKSKKNRSRSRSRGRR
ncbi:GPKOW family protein [Megaselia abdita]